MAGDTGGAPNEKAEGDSVGRETSQPWNGIAVNLKELSNLGGIVAAATAISLCASIAYDWGYFRALGIAFGEAPTRRHRMICTLDYLKEEQIGHIRDQRSDCAIL